MNILDVCRLIDTPSVLLICRLDNNHNICMYYLICLFQIIKMKYFLV